MKRTFVIILLSILLTFSALSQSLIWRVQDEIKNLLEDGHGNVYTARTYGAPDSLNTIKKIDSQGSVVWETNVTTNYFTMHYSGYGIYICPFNWGMLNSNQILYYDTNGVLQWTYTMPFTPVTFGGIGQTDQNGDLVFAYESSKGLDSGSIKILKLNRLGEKILDANIPKFNYPFITQPWFMGPYVNASGNIWIVLVSVRDTSKTTAKMTLERETGYEDAYLIDGVSGKIITHTTIFKGLTMQHQNWTNGDSKEFDTDGSPYTQCVTYGDDLISCGSWHTMKSVVKKAIRKSFDEKTIWQIARVSKSGNINVFSYRGNGSDSYSDRSNGKVVTDATGNMITSIEIGNQNEIFIYGTIAKGKNKNGIGNFHMDEILVRFDPNKNKFVWKISNPQPVGSYTSVKFYPSIQKFLRGIIVNTCNNALDVIDVNGKVSTQKLTFPECVWIPPVEPSVSLQGPNYESGMIYIWASSGLSKFDLTSSLAKMSFQKDGYAETPDLPGTFALQQNYPNPFNPITTIRFSLMEPSVVTLKIYNLLGQEVQTLLNDEMMDEGEQSMEFDASNLPSGVYFYKISAQGESRKQFQAIKRMVLLK